MKNTFCILLLFLLSFNLKGQASYSGFIGKYPIELAADIYSDGVARAVYAYSKYDEPIVINGRLEQEKLTLFEKDKIGIDKAVITFENFNAESRQLEGIWADLGSGKEFKVSLTKMFDIAYGENLEWSDREICD